jgi:hypothetical protein
VLFVIYDSNSDRFILTHAGDYERAKQKYAIELSRGNNAWDIDKATQYVEQHIARGNIIITEPEVLD